MAILRANEIRKMDKKKLGEQENDLRREMLKLQMQVASGTPPEKPGRIRLIKRTIARIKTIQNEGGKK